MERLKAGYPELIDRLLGLNRSQLGLLAQNLTRVIRDAGLVPGIDWDSVIVALSKGGDLAISKSMAAVSEECDNRAFDYSDSDDQRYEIEFARARLVSCVSYACFPLDFRSMAEAVYEFASASGDPIPARRVMEGRIDGGVGF